ncbi:MAG: hypothetical protein WAZ77_03065 [Candidatus Nitrosopolaris sp.]|jgi:hypothetical protein
MAYTAEGQLNPSVIEQSPIKNEWKCSDCGKIFASLYILNYHKLLQHGESKRPPIGVA